MAKGPVVLQQLSQLQMTPARIRYPAIAPAAILTRSYQLDASHFCVLASLGGGCLSLFIGSVSSLRKQYGYLVVRV